MKKLFALAAVAAALSLSACSGSTSANTAEEDSLALETGVAGGVEPAAVVNALTGLVQEGDAQAITDAVANIQNDLAAIINTGDAEKAAEYASKIQAFVEENADKLQSFNINTTTLNDIISAAKALPVNAESTAAAAAEAVQSDAQAAVDAQVQTAKDKADEAVEAAKAKASETVDAAKAKANETVETGKAKANEAVQDAATKANKAASDAINDAASKLKL